MGPFDGVAWITAVGGEFPALAAPSQCVSEPAPAGIQNPNGRITPVTTGTATVFGFDAQSRAFYDTTCYDMMNYCSNQWIARSSY